ncbi:type II secretion system GspH family protein [Patescibacteria group bacterium]|nr:type II secretion system GspH family protein [Patescibacteria group bacterium]
MIPTKLSQRRGFTLIEMIVSLGVFSVVVTITAGALITLIATNQRFQREQNTTTNLAFALDSMTREIRTGSNFYCATGTGTPFDNGAHEHLSGGVIDAGVGSSLLRRDCPDGRNGESLHGISFFEGGNSITTDPGVRRILYYFDLTAGTIYRRVGDERPEQIISNTIEIVDADIYVTDTNIMLATPADTKQPTVTIHIEARDRSEPSSETYLMQTTVTQRSLDI